MKTKIVVITLLIVSAAAFTGCKKVNGKGAVETRVFEASGFDKVDLSNVGEVILVNDASQFVEIEDDVVFTVEYSVRAAQMAVYQLLAIDRMVPPITPHDKSLRAQFEAMIKALK